jgi:hypothetical protein
MAKEMTAGPAALVLTATVARRYYLDGASKSDIAAELGVSRAAVEALLVRARRSFRLVYEGVAASPESLGCPELAPSLSALIDNELDSEVWQGVSDHLRRCRRCRRGIKDLRHARLLYLLIPVLGPPTAWSLTATASAASLAVVTVGAPPSQLPVAVELIVKLASLAGAKAPVVAAAGLGVALLAGPVLPDDRGNSAAAMVENHAAMPVPPATGDPGAWAVLTKIAAQVPRLTAEEEAELSWSAAAARAMLQGTMGIHPVRR